MYSTNISQTPSSELITLFQASLKIEFKKYFFLVYEK